MTSSPKTPADPESGLTHPGKELWPGVTKADLAAYWQSVASVALIDIAARPLAVVRCPDGIDGPHFFQKHAHSVPSAIRASTILGQPYLAIDDSSGLMALTQIAAIELHGWQVTERDPDHPDRVVFDLDPGDDVKFTKVVEAARLVRDHLARLGFVSFCRTTGGKGLHVVVPLSGAAGWEQARGFARETAEALAKAQPERFVATPRKEAREGHVYVDWLRNGPGAMAIESYSPRARAGATVATPLRWEEVTETLDPHAWTMRTVPARAASIPDPWPGYRDARQDVP